MAENEDWRDSTTVTQVMPPTESTGEHPATPTDRALLIVLVGEDAGRTHVVEQETVIGRSIDAEVRISAHDVSRRHAVIRREAPGEFVLEDLQSKNGTLVNGEPVQRHRLEYGEKIRIGNRSILMFTRYDEVEDQLLQAQRLETVGKLASGVAHDLNNIIGAILANTGFLRGLGPGVTFAEQDVKDCIQDIDVAAQRAAQISRQLLGLTRRDDREDVLVDVGELVHEVLTLVGRTFERSVTVEDEVEVGLQVKGDPAQLHQMLMNLCINARDAMVPRGGTLTVRVRSVHHAEGGEVVELSVADTGSGISGEVRRRMFEPFFTTKGKGEGTGLGLSTVLSIVRQHGGDVELDSEEGRGTTFWVHLPLAGVREPMEARPTSGPARTLDMRRGLVLLVDDEEVFRNSARRLLEGLGYPVQVARDGIEAVQVFDLHKDMIDVVILDLVMPNMDGEQTLEALRRIDPNVRVLISSGQTELKRVRGLLRSGAQGFLQKPYDAGAVGEAISSATFGPRGWRGVKKRT